MSPAFNTRSRTLFTAAAAVVLGLQVAPWTTTLPAQENAPAPLIVQAQARPITPAAPRVQQDFNNPMRSAQPAPPQQPMPQRSGPPQAPKSEVQKELEKLYQQNGRAVPEMVDPKFSQPANGQPGGTPPAAAAQMQGQTSPQYSPAYQAATVSAPKKKGFFGKLFGSKDEGPTQPPVEPGYTPPGILIQQPVVQPTGQPAPTGTGLPNYSQLFAPPTAAGGAAPQPPQQFAQQPQSQPMVLPAITSRQPLVHTAPAQFPLSQPAPQTPVPVQSLSPVAAAPADDGFEAPLFVEETPTANGSNALPAIDFNAPITEPDTVDLGQAAPLPVAKPAESADPFSDDALFPGATTPVTAAPTVVPNSSVAQEATPVETIPPASEEAPVEENPYSGLTLDADPFSNPSALKAAPVAPPQHSLEAPAFDEVTIETDPPALMTPPAEEADVPPPVAEQPAQRFAVPSPEESSDEPPLVVEESPAHPPARLVPAPRSTNEQTRAKQEMIAARKGLKGLKGFCPVVLRDGRDLLDAHSQFRVIYNSKTYYLSSSQAVSAFHSDPAKYAPAVRGCDVIQQAISGEEIEGSLDFAVWYKGRLYLFSSAETMDTFVSAPSSHATLD